MVIGIIQIHSIPAMVEKNVQHGIDMYKEAVQKGAELVVFPELWTCGYYLETPQFEEAVTHDVKILKIFCKLARENKTVIILPLPIKKNDNLYIGLYVIEKNGTVIADYKKSFLWGREQNYFVHGERKYTPIDTSVGKIGTLICYDIEFPEPARLLALQGAQIIFVPSVWSIPALNRWEIQLPARALDNTVFLVGINNVGENACGNSKILSPMGEVIARGSADKEEVICADIDLGQVDKVREKIPYLREYEPNLTPGGKEKQNENI